MIVDLRRTRALQSMLFGTEAGEYLLELLMAAGHFREELETDRDRIEQNLAKGIIQACGVQVVFKTIELPEKQPVPVNVVDQILETKEGPEL